MSLPKAGPMTSFTASGRRLSRRLGLILLLGLAGPAGGWAKQDKAQEAAAALPPSVAEKPAPLQPGYALFYQQGETHAVLNAMRVGLDAFQLGDWAEAEEMFDRALAGIEAVYGNSPEAQKARNLWHEEGSKTFKGEPYERVMAYYYRGLLYYRKGDLDNAGAAFRAGMLQDAFAEEEQNRCDFALLSFLAYWSAMHRGSTELAQQSLQDLKTLRPDFEVPDPQSNVLFLIEMGPSPRKLADGVSQEELKFFRGKNRAEMKAEIWGQRASRPLDVYPMEDIAWQAMSRGGRQVDKILKGKAQFKSTTSDAGLVLTEAGSQAITLSSAFSGSAATNLEIAGGALEVVGAGAQLIAMKVKANADTRYWDNLSESVHVAAVRLSPGQYQVEVKFYDANGQELPQYLKKLTVDAPAQGDTLVWVRSRQVLTSSEPHLMTLPPKERYKSK